MSAALATLRSSPRNPRLAKVHIAKKELRLDEAVYRAILLRITGKTSAGDCTDDQLDAVLEELKLKGWKPSVVSGSSVGARAAGPRAADHPTARKARAMWRSLYDLGVVRDPGEPALEAFARRQLKVERFQWADQSLAYKLVEALKAMAEREGWFQYLGGIPPRNQVRQLLRRLATRQAEILAEAGVATTPIGELNASQIEQLRGEIARMGRAIRELPSA